MTQTRQAAKKELKKHKRNLQKLRLQKANFASGEEPLRLLNQIEYEEQSIAELESLLDGLDNLGHLGQLLLEINLLEESHFEWQGKSGTLSIRIKKGLSSVALTFWTSLQDILRFLDYPEPKIEDIKLAYSELINNGLEHGCVTPEDYVQVKITLTPRYCRMKVQDFGKGFDLESVLALAQERISDPEFERGRGLLAVWKSCNSLQQVSPNDVIAIVLSKSEYCRYNMNIDEKRIAIIQIIGSLDMNTVPKLRYIINQGLTDDNIKFIVFDFTECNFIDSSGASLLVHAFKIAKESGTCLALANPKHLCKMFELWQFDRVFNIYESVEEAKRALLAVNEA